MRKMKKISVIASLACIACVKLDLYCPFLFNILTLILHRIQTNCPASSNSFNISRPRCLKHLNVLSFIGHVWWETPWFQVWNSSVGIRLFPYRSLQKYNNAAVSQCFAANIPEKFIRQNWFIPVKCNAYLKTAQINIVSLCSFYRYVFMCWFVF